MADEAKSAPSKDRQKPTLFVVLLLVNSIAMFAMAFIIYQHVTSADQNDKVGQIEEGIDQEENGERSPASEGEEEDVVFGGPVIPLETFIVNLAGSQGRRLARVSIEVELTNEEAQTEIERRKAQIRDIIIILLSSKTYEEINTREGREFLRIEIKDTVNAFMTRGKIRNIYFTEFLYE